MFAKKKLKSKERIPETLCFISGYPTLWLFNSKKDPKSPFILKKNPENIKDMTILNEFLGLRGFNDPLENNML
jgi:hypothetical protein